MKAFANEISVDGVIMAWQEPISVLSSDHPRHIRQLRSDEAGCTHVAFGRKQGSMVIGCFDEAAITPQVSTFFSYE